MSVSHGQSGRPAQLLSVVRHGRTAANAARQLQGRTDNPLDELGHRQAAAIAAALSTAEVPVDRLISSPLKRAQHTATPLAELNGLEIETDDRWIELDYGAWEQRRATDVSTEQWKAWRSDPHFSPPDGESLVDLNARVRSACNDIASTLGGEHVAVFTHVSPIKAAVAWALGADRSLSIAMGWRMNVGQAQITTISLGSDTPLLLSFNSLSHL